jgi:hypothetical protein
MDMSMSTAEVNVTINWKSEFVYNLFTAGCLEVSHLISVSTAGCLEVPHLISVSTAGCLEVPHLISVSTAGCLEVPHLRSVPVLKTSAVHCTPLKLTSPVQRHYYY